MPDLRMMIRSVYSIIDYHTALVVLTAVISTWLCRRLEWFADFPLTMAGTAVIFPIVFSIGGAYKRREGALDDYGNAEKFVDLLPSP